MLAPSHSPRAGVTYLQIRTNLHHKQLAPLPNKLSHTQTHTHGARDHVMKNDDSVSAVCTHGDATFSVVCLSLNEARSTNTSQQQQHQQHDVRERRHAITLLSPPPRTHPTQRKHALTNSPSAFFYFLQWGWKVTRTRRAAQRDNDARHDGAFAGRIRCAFHFD